MSADRLLFNLLINATSSFLAAVIPVALCLTLCRAGASRLKLFLLTLPFVKIVWDFARGVPAHSFVFFGLDPWLPALQRVLWVDAGFSYTVPRFNVAMAVKEASGREFDISVAEFFWSWLATHVNPIFPAVLLATLFTGSLFLIARRILAYRRFERARRSEFASAKVIEWPTVGRRRVAVYRSALHRGSPFTGGVVAPYVCFPEESLSRLDDAEYRAVLQHELAHVRRADFPLTFALQMLGDAFWFVPGHRALTRRIDRLREVLADAEAVKCGASATHLASALVKIRECAPPPVYSAFFREASLLRERVARLVGDGLPERPRWPWRHRGCRWLIAFWTVGCVFFSSLGGNA